MSPRTRFSTRAHDDKPDPSRKPRKRQRVEDPAFVRLKLGPTRRTAEVELREPKKKPKKQKASINRNRGRLTVFTGLPLDILSEVTSFLSPLDILKLSRVSQSFRQLFNPHIARHFWVNARRNVIGLPECPPDLSEAQYASLMFENHCQACGSWKGDQLDFALRHRTCRRCYEELTEMGNNISRNLGGKQCNDIVFKLVPPSCIGYAPDADGGIEYLGLRITGWKSMHQYNIRELTSVIEQYMRLNRNKKRQQEFVEKREKLTKMMMETGKAMFEWYNKQEKQKKEEDRVKSELCLREAEKRLLELGWTQKDLDHTKKSIVDRMYRPQKLTSRVWKQYLPFLEASMMKNRRDCRLRELCSLWPFILEKLVPASERVFFPGLPGIKDIPCIQILLDRDSASVEIKSQSLEDIFPCVLQETRDHRDAVKRLFLREILASEEYNPPLNGRRKRARLADNRISPDDPRLFYARHLFLCYGKHCSRKFVISLTKFYDHARWVHADSDRPNWVIGLVETDTIQAVMKEILKVMDLPEDAKAEDVEPFDRRLKCGCDETGRRRFGFVSLVQHFYELEPSESHLPSKVAEMVTVHEK